jgi:hypothetical protein
MAFLDREVATRRGRAQTEASTDPQVKAEIAEQLATADALTATWHMLEHYKPVDNSQAETQRIEVPA